MTAVCGGLLLSLRPLSVRTARGVSRPPFRGPSRRRVPRYVYDASSSGRCRTLTRGRSRRCVERPWRKRNGPRSRLLRRRGTSGLRRSAEPCPRATRGVEPSGDVPAEHTPEAGALADALGRAAASQPGRVVDAGSKAHGLILRRGLGGFGAGGIGLRVLLGLDAVGEQVKRNAALRPPPTRSCGRRRGFWPATPTGCGIRKAAPTPTPIGLSHGERPDQSTGVGRRAVSGAR